ncbi:MAG: glycosyltransferase [Muribaculaceae bacterium]|nr:glycosyltransferase [Muribaculaceae bacterium]
MDNPLISLITITFNAAGEIVPTMKSIAEQSFRDFEHIVVDGASTDATLQLVRQMGGRSVKILSEPDDGLYDAMNKGLKMARGMFVLFLNAGDSFATPGTLELYAKAASNGADIIYADTVIVDAVGNILRPRHLSVPEVLTPDSFADGMLICHQAFMVKRNIAPLYNLQYRFSADYDWTIRCIKHTLPERCVNLHSVTIHYLDNGMTEKNKKASLKERFAIMKEHYGIIRTVGKHLSFIPRAVARKFS